MFSETFSTLCWWKSTESQVETYDSHSFLLFSLVGMILMEYWLENGVLSYVIFFRRTVKDLKRMIWKVCTPFNLSKRVLWPYKQNAFSKNRFLHTLLSALSFIAILLKGLFFEENLCAMRFVVLSCIFFSACAGGRAELNSHSHWCYGRATLASGWRKRGRQRICQMSVLKKGPLVV